MPKAADENQSTAPGRSFANGIGDVAVSVALRAPIVLLSGIALAKARKMATRKSARPCSPRRAFAKQRSDIHNGRKDDPGAVELSVAR